MEQTLQFAIDALNSGSLYAMAALGIGLLFGVLRLINFAHGDFITVGGYSLIVPSTSAAAAMFFGNLPWPLLILAAAMTVIALALISELVVFRPLRGASPSTLMIGSFALSFIIQNTLLAIYSSRPKAVNLWSSLSEPLAIGGLEVQKLQLVTIGTSVILLGVLGIFLKKTRFGLEMRAAAEDGLMARMLGVRANLVIALALAISGFLAAISSLLYLAQAGVLSYQMGVPLMMFAFIATVIGGMGSLLGAVIGAYLIGILGVVAQVALPADLTPFRDAFVFALVVVVLLWRPTGIVQVSSMKERV